MKHLIKALLIGIIMTPILLYRSFHWLLFVLWNSRIPEVYIPALFDKNPGEPFSLEFTCYKGIKYYQARTILDFPLLSGKELLKRKYKYANWSAGVPTNLNFYV